jgi:predicted Zn-dependent peptidase
VVAAAGSVDHDQLVEILTRTGWSDRATGRAKPTSVPPAVPPKPSRKHFTREGSQTHIVLGSPTLGYQDKRRHAMVLLSVVLGGGMSSRLFQRVREELGLAYSVYTFQTFYASCGVHGVYVGTAPKTAGAALRAIEEELAAVADAGLPDAEIAQGKGQLKGQITLSLESPTARMYRAAAVDLYGEPYRTLDEMLALVDAIEPGTIHELAREFFAPDAQTVVSLGPSQKPIPRRARRRG